MQASEKLIRDERGACAVPLQREATFALAGSSPALLKAAPGS